MVDLISYKLFENVMECNQYKPNRRTTIKIMPQFKATKKKKIVSQQND